MELRSIGIINSKLFMNLPSELSDAIQQEIAHVDRATLAQAAAQLTAQYKAGQFSSPAIRTEVQRAAYLAIRVPATFAANLRVFSELRRLAPDEELKSIIDLGAGPATAVHAAVEVFPSLTQATLIEMDANIIAVGKRVAEKSSRPVFRSATWRQQNITQGWFEPHDLVVMSYVLGELSPATTSKIVLRALEVAQSFLVLVEPGTKRGFAMIRDARAALINAGAHICAPCPHALECPMVAAGDWCHFAQRLERTSLHRQIKSGALGHEDEKFSYVIFSRMPLATARARIVRHPQKHSGHVQLMLCTSQGLQNKTISKSQKEAYRAARKAAWGDPWSESSS